MMCCKFCNRVCKNKNSLAQHELRCVYNPNRLITKRPIGYKHTDETKLLISKKVKQNWADGKLKIPAEFDWTDRKHSGETRSKISRSMLGNTNGNHRGDRQSYFKNIRMDSSWEVKVAEYLDSNNIRFEYGLKVFDMGITTYRPDFYLIDIDMYVEVKGYWRVANLEKFNLFKSLFPEIKIEVWNKKKLKQLNLI